MRSRLPAWSVVVLLSALLVLSCTSVPAPKDANDTLLIIPVSFTAPAAGQYAYFYSFELEGLEETIEVRPTTARYVAVPHLPPGSYTLAYVTVYPLSGSSMRALSTADRSETPRVPIVLKGGGVTIADFLVETEVKDRGGGRYMQSWDLKKPTPEQLNAIMEDLSRQKPFQEWELAS